MAFNFFTQPQGPNIDINLYPNAVSAGINAGNAQKTPLQNIVAGINQGLETVQQFQQVQSNALTIAAKQNAVDQLPVENQIREEQLKSQQTANKINDLKAQIAADTQQEALDAEREELLNKASKAAEDRQLREQKNQFQNEFVSLDPLSQKQLLMSGKYNNVFAANPNVFSQALGMVRPYLNQAEQASFDTMLRKASTSQAIQREAAQRQQAFQQARQALTDDFNVLEAADAAKILPEDVPYKARLVPHGKYENTPSGLVENEGFDPADAAGRYDIIIGNKIVSSGAEKSIRALFGKYKNERAWQDGTYQNRALSAIDQAASARAAAAQANQQAQTSFAPEQQAQTPSSKQLYGTNNPNPAAVRDIVQTPVKTRSGQINVANNPYAYDVVQKSLGLSAPSFNTIKPQVGELLKVAEAGPIGYGGTYSTDQVTALESAVSSISQYTAGTAFDSNPKVAAAYTPEMVKAHNSNVDLFENALRFGVVDKSSAVLYGGEFKGEDISQMQKVESPRDLYILRNKGVYSDILNRIVNGYAEQVRATRLAMVKSASTQKELLAQLAGR